MIHEAPHTHLPHPRNTQIAQKSLPALFCSGGIRSQPRVHATYKQTNKQTPIEQCLWVEMNGGRTRGKRQWTGYGDEHFCKTHLYMHTGSWLENICTGTIPHASLL